MDATRKTTGQEAVDRLLKTPDSQDPIELGHKLQEDYLKYLINTTTDAKKEHPGDFFVVVITKQEHLMPNVFRNYYGHRSSCPTPDYDQAVYHYKKDKDDLEFLWCVPSRETCQIFKDNVANIVPSERVLLKMVLDFSDGTLFKLCKKLNGEALDTPLLVEGTYDRKGLERIK